MLEIVISHWNEPWDVGEKAFRMLALQRRIYWDDVTVTLIHDGTDAFPEEYFADLPFSVHQVCLPHGGISAVRNYAIDHSEADWIKFCDFDDMFAGVLSLSSILDALDDPDHDVLWFPLIIDRYHKDLLIQNCSTVFIHDKVFRVSMLRDNGFRFNTSLTFSEDYAFQCQLFLGLGKERFRKIESDFPIYVYIQRPGSVANRKDYWYKNHCAQFDMYCYVESLVRGHGHAHNADLLFVRAMMEGYYTLMESDMSINTDEFWAKVRGYYRQHPEILQRITGTEVETLIDETNEQNRSEITKAEFMYWVRQYMR